MFDSLVFLYYVVLALAALVGLFALGQAVYPRLTWVLTKWQYRTPDAVEPSRWVFELRRIKAVVLFLVMLFVVTTLVSNREAILDVLGNIRRL